MLTKKIELYADRQDVTLTTYVLDDSPELLNGKKRPAVLVCPGGGYIGCSDREAEPVALRFAAMGYHAFVLRYSTYSGGALGEWPPTGDMPSNPRCVHPGPVRDIGKAFLTIGDHADDWLVDMNKIAICGFSAGGHNCAMYAVYWHDPLICAFFDAMPERFKPAAAIIAYGLSDYHLMVRPAVNGREQEIRTIANRVFLGTATPSQALLDSVSPALHVTEQTPPTFVWATSEDTLVPVENSTRLAHALAQVGVPFEVHIFEKGKHGLSLANLATAASRLDLDDDASRWIGLVDAWLQKRFAPDLPALPDWMAEGEGDAHLSH
ncbi:alpha/beta hydrolase [Caldilinea sp.]|uniref:alpha/beta hydrolase n=1 Tax=Caldilinea sp. TaxID=2293560 RepID=UPI002C95A1BF|nr:alpha/beta hydrolase [Anaerolineales bacterium]HQY90499.1 alpha/beta hydrolase [Caldilinea sp.]